MLIQIFTGSFVYKPTHTHTHMLTQQPMIAYEITKSRKGVGYLNSIVQKSIPNLFLLFKTRNSFTTTA